MTDGELRLDDMARVLLTDPSDGQERRTIQGWDEVVGDLQVIDPDGFDRSDIGLYGRLFTRQEWEHGAMRSTCKFSQGYKWCELCLREPASYDPILGIYVCAKCLQEMDELEPDEEP